MLTTVISDGINDFDRCTLILCALLTSECFIQTYFFLPYFPKVFTCDIDRRGLYMLNTVI